MSLFGKIKSIIKKPAKKAKKDKIEIVKKTEIKKPTSKPVSKKRNIEINKILKEPHVSEKSTQLSDDNKYTFNVYPWANKIQIKDAVKNLYGVEIKEVNIINIKAKKRSLQGREGKKHGYKKAIVTLEKGHKIELLPH
jgi:large subunit ribosomal protein L23